MPQVSANNGRWCIVTATLAVNFALLISAIGIGLYISLNLQAGQDSLWQVGKFLQLSNFALFFLRQTASNYYIFMYVH